MARKGGLTGEFDNEPKLRLLTYDIECRAGPFELPDTCPLKVQPVPNKHEPFTNRSIIAPRTNKPHICKRGEWWRVSPLHGRRDQFPHRAAIWYKAHTFVQTLNVKRVLNRRGDVSPIIERMTRNETECTG